MKKYLYLFLLILCASCSHHNKVDDVVISYWNAHKAEKNVVIDFSKCFDFEWDTLCFYSVGCSLDEINQDLGFELAEYTDLADRMVFLNHKKWAYTAGWWYDPEDPKGITISTKNNIFKVSYHKAKFKIKREGNIFILEPLDF